MDTVITRRLRLAERAFRLERIGFAAWGPSHAQRAALYAAHGLEACPRREAVLAWACAYAAWVEMAGKHGAE